MEFHLNKTLAYIQTPEALDSSFKISNESDFY